MDGENHGILLLEVGNARLGETDKHPIRPKSPTSKKNTPYREKEEKEKTIEVRKGDELPKRQINKHWPYS